MVTEDIPAFDDTEAVQRLLSAGCDADDLWSDAERAEVWRHQLEVPVWVDVGEQLDPVCGVRASELCAAHPAPAVRTFADLFAHDRPDADLLRLVKQFAQASLHRPDPPLPRAMSVLLYDLSVVAARFRCGVRLTDMPDAKLAESLGWVAAQPWLDPRTRAWCADAQAVLAAERRRDPR